MEGKTVERVEFGIREDIKGVHGSECMLVHFTDGTILGLETGSNVFNITSSREDLTPEQFQIDIALTWVPSLEVSTNDTAT
jgi:hypothetical protein